MVDVSKKLQEGVWGGNYPKYEWSLGVGTAMMLFAGVTVLAGATSLATSILGFFSGKKDPLLSLAQSMVSVSIKLQEGIWNGKYPSLDWVNSIGQSMITFSGLSSKIPSKSILAFFTGVDPLLSLSQSMVSVSIKMQEGIWNDNYPTLDWVNSIGQSMMTFSVLSLRIPSKSILSFFTGIDPLVSLSQSMVSVSIKLQEGVWNGKYPTLDWVNSVGQSMITFSGLSLRLSSKSILDFFTGEDPLLSLSQSMVNVSRKLQEGIWGTNYPTLDWVNSVGQSMITFSGLSLRLPSKTILDFFTDEDPLVSLSQSMVNVSKKLQEGTWNDNYPTLNWVLSVGQSMITFSLLASKLSPTTILEFFTGKDPLLELARSMYVIDLMFSSGKFVKYPSLDWINNIGLSIKEFSNLVLFVNSIGFLSIMIGLGSIMALVSTISSVDVTFNKGTFVKYPPLEWLNGVKTSVYQFGLLAVELGTLIAGSLGVAAILGIYGIGAILALVSTIYAVDVIFNKGSFTKFPSFEWINGVKSSIYQFGLLALELGMIIVGTFGIAAMAGIAGMAAAISLAGTMLTVDQILNLGTFTKYPPEIWTRNVVKSLEIFSAMKIGGGGIGGMISAFFKSSTGSYTKIAKDLADVSLIISKGSYVNAPDANYIRNITAAIVSMIELSKVDLSDFRTIKDKVEIMVPALIMLSRATQMAIPVLYVDNLSKLISVLRIFPDKSREVRNLAYSLKELSKSLKDIKAFESLSNVSASIALLSAVDDVKLQIILDKIKENEDTLKTVYGQKNASISDVASNILQSFSDLVFSKSEDENKEKDAKIEAERIKEIKQEQYYSDISEIKMLLYQLVEHQDKPTQAGSFHK